MEKYQVFIVDGNGKQRDVAGPVSAESASDRMAKLQKAQPTGSSNTVKARKIRNI